MSRQADHPMNPQSDEFDQHVQKILQYFNEMKAASLGSEDPQQIQMIMNNCLNKLQGSTRYLLYKVNKLYSETMPPKRQQKCEEISNDFWNILQKTLEFTPVVRQSVRSKMFVAMMMKSIHDSLQSVDINEEANIPAMVRQMQENVHEKLQQSISDVDLKNKCQALTHMYQSLLKKIVEEQSKLDLLAEEHMETAQRSKDRSRVLLVLALICGAASVAAAIGLYYANAHYLSKVDLANMAENTLKAATADLDALQANYHKYLKVCEEMSKHDPEAGVASILGQLYYSIKCWWQNGARDAALMEAEKAAAAAAAAAENADVARKVARTAMAGVALCGVGSATCATGAVIAKRRESTARRITQLWSENHDNVVELHKRYEKLRNGTEQTQSSLELLKNFLAAIGADSDFLHAFVNFWPMMKQQNVGKTIDSYLIQLEHQMQSLDVLETNTRQNFAEWTTPPHQKAISVPPVQTKIPIQMPLHERFLPQANNQDGQQDGSEDWVLTGSSDLDVLSESSH